MIHDNRGYTLTHYLVILWAFVIMQADLSLATIPFLNWFVSLFLLPFLVKRYLQQGAIKIIDFYLYGSLLLLLAILVNTPVATDPSYNVEQALKLLAIFLFGFFLLSEHHYQIVIFKAFLAALIVNNILLLLGTLFNQHWAARIIYGESRWMTLFNRPDSLEKVGSVIFLYGFYLLISKSSNKLLGGIISLLSIIPILFDGSRTALLSLSLGGLFILAVVAKETRQIIIKRKNLLLLALLFLVFGIAIFAYWQYICSLLVDIRLFNSLKSFFGQNTLEQVDILRYNMFIEVLNHISEHPWLGGGMGSAKINSPAITGQWSKLPELDIHIAYLQLWANIGLLGFIGFIAISLGWIIYVPRVLAIAKILPQAKDRAVIYNATYILFYFAFSSLFYPFSTEWSEWVYYLYAIAVYWQVMHNHKSHSS